MKRAGRRHGLLRRAERRFLGLTPPQALILSYLGLSAAGAVLLKLPFANQRPLGWLDAWFTAVSAATITGLTAVDPGSQFTLFGQWVLLALMQCGGLGLVTFGILILNLSSGRISLSQRAALRDSFSQGGDDIRQLMRLMLGFMFAMEALGTLLLAWHWGPRLGWGSGLFHGLFHAVSAFNNAGFGLAADSLARERGSALVNLVIPALFVAGGIGFAVVHDLVRKRRFRDYTLHTKLMLVGTLVLNLVAILALLGLEWRNGGTLGALAGWGEKFWAAWFQALTPRSAGFSTVDIGHLLPETAFFLMFLMFIGAGSGSTGGGIKLTTFIVLLLATRAYARQQPFPVVFGRSIDGNTAMKALAIAVIALFCVAAGTFLLAITETAPFLDLAFEALSAATTTGLSRGITPGLSVPGKLVVMLLMLFGRIGPLTLAFTLANPQGARIGYPAGQVNIG